MFILNDFSLKRLGELVEEVRYGTSLPATLNGKYGYLRMNNITEDGKLNIQNLKYIDIPEKDLEKYVVRKGDVLFNRTNSIELVGKTCIYELNFDMVIAGYIIRIRTNNNILNSRYLSEFLNFPSTKKFLRNIAKGAVNQANINAKELQDISVPLPPLALQNEFAEFVAQVDKSQFNEMFEEYPDSVFLDTYIKELRAGKSLAGEENNKNKVLKTGAVSYDYFNSSEVKNLPIDYIPLDEHKVEIGDVIISRMNTSELVGAAGYVWAINNDNIYLPDRLWKVILNDRVNPVFLWKLITNEKTKLKIKRIASGTSGSMKNISKSKFLQIRVPLPPLSLQNEFADFVAQVDKSQFACEIVIKLWRNSLKSSIIWVSICSK